MPYTNDESDKALRKRNYAFAVIVLPLVAALAVGGLLSWLHKLHIISTADNNSGFMYCVFMSVTWHSANKRKWLKMPDGECYSVKSQVSQRKFSPGQPAVFDEVFYNTKTMFKAAVVIGCIIIATAVYMFANSQQKAFAVLMAFSGIGIIYDGIKHLIDKQAKLAVAEAGIWVDKLGFISWGDIANIEVVKKGRRQVAVMLRVFVAGSKFTKAGQPDSTIYLGSIDRPVDAVPVIEKYYSALQEATA